MKDVRDIQQTASLVIWTEYGWECVHCLCIMWTIYENDAFCLGKKAAVICIFIAQEETEQRAEYWAGETYGHPIQFPHTGYR